MSTVFIRKSSFIHSIALILRLRKIGCRYERNVSDLSVSVITFYFFAIMTYQRTCIQNTQTRKAVDRTPAGGAMIGWPTDLPPVQDT
jgi:hypothetical protein